jgi:hypothetical protein
MVLPNESVLPRVVFPLLSRSVVLPKESLLPRVTLPLLSRHVVLPNESVLPRVVFPLLSRQVVLPNESDEHLVCAIDTEETSDIASKEPEASVDFRIMWISVVRLERAGATPMEAE